MSISPQVKAPHFWIAYLKSPTRRDMSKRYGNIVVIAPEPPDELCGTFAELRPYGPGGKRICFECAMKDEKGTEERMNAILFGEGLVQ